MFASALILTLGVVILIDCFVYPSFAGQQLAWRGPGPAVDGFGSSGAPVVLSAVCPCCRVMVTSSPWQ
jgi:hypothetical protein